MKFKFPGQKRRNSIGFGALFENLPVDLKVAIFEHLSLADLRRCRLVCSHWNAVIYGCMKPLRIQLIISFPSEGSPQMTAVKNVTKEDIKNWPSAMVVSSVVLEGFCDSYSSQWVEFIADVLDLRVCAAVTELRTVNILHSEMSAKKLLRHKSLGNVTSATLCDLRLTPRMIIEICRFAKENPHLKNFHISGFDVDHFDEIFDTLLKCSLVVDCSTIAKRGTCTSGQLLGFLQAIIDSGRALTLHGLSIDDLQFNAVMRELHAPHRKGHHLAFFSSNPGVSGPDVAVVFDKTEGPAFMTVSRTENNVLFHSKFLGSLIREQLQDQKPYSSLELKIYGNFQFSGEELVIDSSISGLHPIKPHYFDCGKVEAELNCWFARHFLGFRIRIRLKIVPSKHHSLLDIINRKPRVPEPINDDATVFYQGLLNPTKALETLTPEGNSNLLVSLPRDRSRCCPPRSREKRIADAAGNQHPYHRGFIAVFGMYERQKASAPLHKQLLTVFNQKVPKDDRIRLVNFDAEYEEKCVLGQGRFGEVVKYQRKGKKEFISGKIVKMEMFNHYLQDINKIRARLETFITEYRLLHRLSNGPGKERLAQFIGIYSDSDRLIVFTEHMAGGSVKDLLAQQALPEEIAYKYFYQACEGLNFLHNQRPPVIHRDLKAANLLITMEDNIKLANFGLVRDLAVDGFGIAVASEVTMDFRGTLLYVAPEVLTSDLGPGNRKAYGKPADVWALGCTFIEMLVRNPPHYEYFGKIEIHSELVSRANGPPENQLPYLSKNLIPTASKNIRFIIDKIFEKQPDLRPTVTHLVNVMAEQEKKPFASISDIYAEVQPSTSRQSEQMGRSGAGNDSEEERSAATKLYGSGRKRPTLQKTQNFEGSIDRIDQGPLSKRKDRKSPKKEKEKTVFFSNIGDFLGYNWFKAYYFSTILCKSVAYVLIFLILGIGALLIFFLTALAIIVTGRAVYGQFCDCDISSPRGILISGICLILLFALFFSCCLIALGEYKFRMANRDIRKSRFFVPRPSKDIEFFGVKVIRSKKEESDKLQEEQKEDDIDATEMPNYLSSRRQEDANFDDLYDEREESI